MNQYLPPKEISCFVEIVSVLQKFLLVIRSQLIFKVEERRYLALTALSFNSSCQLFFLLSGVDLGDAGGRTPPQGFDALPNRKIPLCTILFEISIFG